MKQTLNVNSYQGPVSLYARLMDLNTIIEQVFILICSTMVLLANAGFIMKEVGLTSLNSTTALLTKTILVISVSTMSFFTLGFGLSVNA